MSTKRPNLSINKTLLILLGILLACLLTMNAKSIPAETFFPSNQKQTLIDKNAGFEALDKTSEAMMKKFVEKLSSLR